MTRPDREEQRVAFDFSEAEAIVLFEWLMVHGDSLPLSDHAEQILLWRIEARLEESLAAPFDKDCSDQLARARALVRASE